MADASLRKSISAEVLTGGVLITFPDGEEGLYSDELLRASLPSARALLDEVLKQRDGDDSGS